MEPCMVAFEDLEWQPGLPGARSKSVRVGARQVRWLEFTCEFVEPEWCRRGHLGVVLSGELEVDFSGRRVRYPEGSAVLISAGTAHKARAVTPVARMFLVEDAPEGG